MSEVSQRSFAGNSKVALGMIRASALDSQQLRSRLANLFGGVLPTFTSGVVRSRILRLFGFDVHPGAFVEAPIKIISGRAGSHKRLHVGARTVLTTGLVFNLDDHITIEEGVTIGPFCLLYTSTHAIGSSSFRCGTELVTAPIVIERGAWLALNCTILPGVTIGAGAVVAAGSVVTADVAPNTMVGGVPARFIKNLDPA
jgi:maltose O-acetyltransferase